MSESGLECGRHGLDGFLERQKLRGWSVDCGQIASRLRYVRIASLGAALSSHSVSVASLAVANRTSVRHKKVYADGETYDTPQHDHQN